MDQSRYIYHGCVNWFRGAREDQKPGWTTSETGRQRDTVFGKAWGIPVNINYQLNAWALVLYQYRPRSPETNASTYRIL
jgi:hypothetical protein